MRKMLPSRSGQQGEGSHQGGGPDTTLGLMHLRKLFAEFRHPSSKVTQKEQEDKLYNMLPLFCKVIELFFNTNYQILIKNREINAIVE